MSYQEPIYNQNSNSVRNSTIPIVRTSSDVCIFDRPTMSMSGASKIDCPVGGELCDYSGTSYSDIYTATTECYITGGLGASICPTTGVTWDLKVYEDDTLVYTDNFYTSLSGESITNTIFSGAVVTALNNEGYDYTVTGTTFEIMQPYGINNVKLNLETDVFVTGACVGTGGTWSGCSATTTNVCEFIYSGLTTSDTNVFEITGQTSIDLDFTFTADTASMIDSNARFKYEIYRHNKTLNIFSQPAIYKSDIFEWSSYSATSAFTEAISISDLVPDGDYLIKGFYIYDTCTEFGKLLDLSYSTEVNKLGDEYQIYNEDFDFHFVVFRCGEIPIISSSGGNVDSFGSLNMTSMILDGTKDVFAIPNSAGDVAVTLNGLVLAPLYDYELIELASGTRQIRLSGSSQPGDVMGFIYTNSVDANNLKVDTIDIQSTIISGTTNNQGSNKVYFNTTTGMYELYTNLTPVAGNDILVTINGVALASGIDYYISTTNNKRIILEGLVFVNDIVNIYYNTNTDVSGDIFVSSINIDWTVANAPQNTDGSFTIQLSTNETFTNIVNTVSTKYKKNVSAYRLLLGLVGTAGDVLYYRIKNEKKFINICGHAITTTKYSETVEITIQTNLINSY